MTIMVWTRLDISLPTVTQAQHSSHSEYFQHIPLHYLAMTSVHSTVILKNNSQSHVGTASSMFGEKPSDFSAFLDLFQTRGAISWLWCSHATIGIQKMYHIHKDILNKCVYLHLKAKEPCLCTLFEL